MRDRPGRGLPRPYSARPGADFRRDPIPESLPFEILHGDEGLAFILADFVNGADIRMVESRGGARFALKTLQSLAVLRKMFGEELQGDKAAELGVLGFINHTHPAATTQLLEDAVVRNRSACHHFCLAFVPRHDLGRTADPKPGSALPVLEIGARRPFLR